MGVMGRPKKLTGNRKLYSIYIDKEIMDAIDEFVHQEKKERAAYSRSDFFNEAARIYLERRITK